MLLVRWALNGEKNILPGNPRLFKKMSQKTIFQPKPVILFTYNSADTVALDSSSLLEIKMAKVRHEILCYVKNLFGNSKPRDNWTQQ